MADWPYSTTRWQALRAAKLASRPLCEACEMRDDIVAAVAVDHVVSIASGGDAFPAIDGLMSLCKSCHSVKTAAVDRAGGKGVRFKGAAIDGMPIDPLHPFFCAGEGGIPPSRTATLTPRTDVQGSRIVSSGSRPCSDRE